MPRKCIVKVILSREQKEMLEELARRLGTSESETMRMALMDYAKALKPRGRASSSTFSFKL